MLFDDKNPITVTIEKGGTGIILFEGDDTPQILTWEIADGGSLDFIEYEPSTEDNPSGDQWFWSVIMVEADADMPSKTALIDVYTPEGQDDSADYVILNTFTKR
ncbi:hypothetical protein [Psychromonas hadalis]|uniref:hypothetical protein n=1 Tax=Psychromonas hadalis TaxID=211669 RepID=UPI0003B3C379|nr:hypothetical protein [Psychromonas hadalis]